MICIGGSVTIHVQKVESYIVDATGPGRLAADELVSLALVRAQLDVRAMTVAQWRQIISAAFATARSALDRSHHPDVLGSTGSSEHVGASPQAQPLIRAEQTAAEYHREPI